MANKNKAWEVDAVQFPRLLAEIFMAGVTKKQLKDLSASMDLTEDEILQLFQRAEKAFERIKSVL